MSSNLDRELVFWEFSDKPLHQRLELVAPPFGEPTDPFRQLNYIQSHVAELGCKTILLEQHYIDRHYIEDHSIFYSKNYRHLPNYCRRLHFFNLEPSAVKKRFEEIITAGKLEGISPYKREGALFSNDAYLGFCVIKPLDGSPVGRTVLRTYGPQAEGCFERRFASTRKYKVHIAGSELKIYGLGFQQQDVGVSACATTALWSSLQQGRQFENIRPATPAQITLFASQYSLPFGRPLPSEGLSVGQMCQAVQALGASPNMFRVFKEFESARSYIHAATLSGFAPVLIIQKKDNPNENHAVTVTGVKIDSSFDPKRAPTALVDRAAELTAAYIHDDRVGPYIRADVREENHSLYFDIDYRGAYKPETWLLTHILIPLHSKIRTSFTGLRRLTLKVIRECAQEMKVILSAGQTEFPRISFQMRIQRAIDYIEDLIYDKDSLSPKKLYEVFSTIPLSRYVGVIRIESEPFGSFDLLIDTTSTIRNVNYLGVVFKGDHHTHSKHFAEWLEGLCKCKTVIEIQ